jgi:hypothetical protein
LVVGSSSLGPNDGNSGQTATLRSGTVAFQLRGIRSRRPRGEVVHRRYYTQRACRTGPPGARVTGPPVQGQGSLAAAVTRTRRSVAKRGSEGMQGDVEEPDVERSVDGANVARPPPAICIHDVFIFSRLLPREAPLHSSEQQSVPSLEIASVLSVTAPPSRKRRRRPSSSASGFRENKILRSGTPSGCRCRLPYCLLLVFVKTEQ